MPDLSGRQFTDEQRASRYPFADSASLLTRDGLAFGAGWLLDARLYPAGSAAGVMLAAVTVSVSTVTLTIGDPETPVLGAASYALAAGPPARLKVTDPAGRLCGLLVADPIGLAGLASWPAGTHAFAPGSAEFAASLVVPRPEVGLRSIAVSRQPPLVDDAWLAGADGVSLQVEGNTIVVHVLGDPLFVQRECGSAGFVAPVPLQFISGRGPDQHGNYQIIPVVLPGNTGTILRVDPVGPSGLKFSLAGAANVPN